MKKVIITSGYFNPLHIGHINLIREAKKLGDFLVVIVNNDDQVKMKGNSPFMSEQERMEIIKALRYADDVVLSIDRYKEGKHVPISKTLQAVAKKYSGAELFFAKGGDRNSGSLPESEVRMCKDNNIKIINYVGGNKIQSSSWLLKKAGVRRAGIPKRVVHFLAKLTPAFQFLLKGSRRSFSKTIRIFFLYFLFLFKYLLFCRFLGKEFKEIKFLGYKIKIFNFPIFVDLFKEIFISEQYFFRAGNDAPKIIDCGSNVGIGVLYFKFYYPDSQIIAFEPNPSNFGILRGNVESNKLRNVTLFEEALSDECGEVSFYGDKKNSVVNSVMEGVVLQNIIRQDELIVSRVKARKLSEFLNQEIDFIKIDIEGNEDRVLMDLEREDKLKLVGGMAIEYHPYMCEKIKRVEELVDFLTRHQFKCAFENYGENYLISAKKA